MHNREKKLKGEDNERKNIETAKGKKKLLFKQVREEREMRK